MSYSMGQIRKIICGKDAIQSLPGCAKALGASNILIITDPGVYKCGLVDGPAKSLQDAGFKVSVVKDVPPEPSYAQVNEIIRQASEFEADLIVGLGGGSAMDTSKLVALLRRNDATIEQMLFEGAKPSNKGVPTLMIPTTAGTGAEATPNAIVLVPEQELKVGIVNENMISDCVILDPSLTVGLPPHITANTGIDTLCHLMECYYSKKANPLADTVCLAGIRLVARSLRKAYADGSDLQAREDMLLAACYGGIAIASSGTTAIHALSYPLGGRYHIPHGLSNAILMPLCTEANKSSCLDKYASIAHAMGLPCAGKSKEEIADALVAECYKLNADLNVRCDFASLGITMDVVDELVDAGSKVTRLLNNNPKALSLEEIREIYVKLVEANS